MNQTFINLSIYQHLSTLNHQLPLKRFKPRSAATPAASVASARPWNTAGRGDR